MTDYHHDVIAKIPKVSVSRRYECGLCEGNREKYRARDNTPHFAHLCERCAPLCVNEDDLIAHYVEVT